MMETERQSPAGNFASWQNLRQAMDIGRKDGSSDGEKKNTKIVLSQKGVFTE